MIRNGVPAILKFAVPPRAQGPPTGVPVKVQFTGAVSATLSAVSGGAAVGAKVMRDVAAAKGAAGSMIRFGETVETPDPAPLATIGGRVKSWKLTFPLKAAAWAPEAKAMVMPAVTTNPNSPRIMELLPSLPL
jgi:hypothetical protein